MRGARGPSKCSRWCGKSGAPTRLSMSSLQTPPRLPPSAPSALPPPPPPHPRPAGGRGHLCPLPAPPHQPPFPPGPFGQPAASWCRARGPGIALPSPEPARRPVPIGRSVFPEAPVWLRGRAPVLPWGAWTPLPRRPSRPLPGSRKRCKRGLWRVSAEGAKGESRGPRHPPPASSGPPGKDSDRGHPGRVLRPPSAQLPLPSRPVRRGLGRSPKPCNPDSGPETSGCNCEGLWTTKLHRSPEGSRKGVSGPIPAPRPLGGVLRQFRDPK